MNDPSEKTKIIVVGGKPRSGTGLLRNLLGSHPGLSMFDTDWAILNVLPKLRSFTGIDEIKSTEDYDRVFNKILNQHPFVSKWELHPDELKPFYQAYPIAWHSVFFMMVEAKAAQDPNRVVVVKSPTLEGHFQAIQTGFQDRPIEPYFIYSLRDPKSCYLSHRRGWTKKSKRNKLNLINWCGRWLSSVETIRDHKQQNRLRLYIAQFEKIIGDPLGEAKALCRFLGLEDHAETMVEMKGLGDDSSYDNKNVPYKKGGVLDLSQRPSDPLATQEILWLQLCYDRVGNELGYETPAEFSGASSGRQLQFVEQQLALEQLRTSQIFKLTVPLLIKRVWRSFRSFI